MASSCVVTAVETNASALPPRQFEQLHVETASPGVKVAVTRWGGGENWIVILHIFQSFQGKLFDGLGQVSVENTGGLFILGQKSVTLIHLKYSSHSLHLHI